ncbi:D-3-phosphoglycerate dehydrogenase [Sodiomyces alkalinus F11]|uniref:D-3-phosphoglycerate dehydrogenase n=1 Tax=Sodiomyces alkalinus (strain CBS 110278 / VKM F-3762 / F11) TaxID=1314773 RepID=A0A3N2PYY2_SODAK|nr:D-3-phosphoglycerate dehydrogenase [Sodiomyces alkalinus F11]ROT39636.1 D-3-phosphoglycerate dehydrogenase [Sodiomyces alkalinus F11]
MASNDEQQCSIAVLDDYQGISIPHFDKLDRTVFSVTTFRDTLSPWGHPDTPQHVKEALVHRLEPFQVICTMRERTPFPKALIARLPNLRLLLTTGLRNASLDLPALSAASIPVAGTTDSATAARTRAGSSPPGAANSTSTTEHAAALILAAARNLARDDLAVKSGLWQTGLAVGLAGKTLGVVGLGRLGAATARTMHLAFGMRIAAWSPNLTQETADRRAVEMGLPVEIPGVVPPERTFRAVDRAALFAASDVVSVHLVLSERSRGLVAADDLGRMKKTAILVNTSRGPLVEEADLLDVLKKGRIRAAALDVFALEPLPFDSEWRTTKWGQEGRSHVVLTPHMGYVEQDTLDAWYAQQVENIRRWHAGQPLINPLT